VLPLGVDLDVFQPDAEAGAAVRGGLGWTAGGPPVVGFLGRFVAEKGLELLTRALEQVATPWRALFVGGGALEARLRTWAAKRGDQVRVVTNVSHNAVPQYLAAMDLLVAPSQTTPGWREQFGRMLIEAMACGLPVVGSDSGEIPFVLADAGLVVGEKNAEAWADSLTKLLDSPGQRADLSARGLDRVRTEYSWPVVARQHLDFFNELMATPAG
jgi:glycosyltransferase involved in cell wall biosynthesis